MNEKTFRPCQRIDSRDTFTSLEVACIPATGNPPGYGSEHLAHVGRLFVDVDMGGLVRSLGHRPLVDGSVPGQDGEDP